eukprot:GFYU01009820.1.p1 GENE.GFYU01009820.1~~GFYU01009820.1.p1  ORF type:complete len:285 (+),score=30.37 GFYU01009820.1:46-900(+)
MRVRVFENGCAVPGFTILCPPSLSDLFQTAATKLSAGAKVYKYAFLGHNGDSFDDMRVLEHDDVVVVSETPVFLIPPGQSYYGALPPLRSGTSTLDNLARSFDERTRIGMVPPSISQPLPFVVPPAIEKPQVAPSPSVNVVQTSTENEVHCCNRMLTDQSGRWDLYDDNDVPGSDHHGRSYFVSPDSDSTFLFKVPKSCFGKQVRVAMWWPSSCPKPMSDNVCVRIGLGGNVQNIVVDQTAQGGGWVPLGSFMYPSETPEGNFVEVGGGKLEAWAVANAVKFSL